jgi:hypothetical protein
MAQIRNSKRKYNACSFNVIVSREVTGTVVFSIRFDSYKNHWSLVA